VGEAVVNYRVDAAIAEQNLGDARSRGIPTESGGEVGNENIADFEQLMGEDAGREDRFRAQRFGFDVAVRSELQSSTDLFAEGERSVVERRPDEEVDALVGQIVSAVMRREQRRAQILDDVDERVARGQLADPSVET